MNVRTERNMMGMHNGFIIKKAIVIECVHAHMCLFWSFWFLLPSHPLTAVPLV